MSHGRAFPSVVEVFTEGKKTNKQKIKQMKKSSPGIATSHTCPF